MTWAIAIIGGLLASLAAFFAGSRTGHRKGVRRTWGIVESVQLEAEQLHVRRLEEELTRTDDLIRRTKLGPITEEEAQALLNEVNRLIPD